MQSYHWVTPPLNETTDLNAILKGSIIDTSSIPYERIFSRGDRFGRRAFFTPTNIAGGLDTTTLPNGRYKVIVTARNEFDVEDVKEFTVKIAN